MKNPKSLCTLCSNKVQLQSNFQIPHPWYPHRPQQIALLWCCHSVLVSVIRFICHYYSLLVYTCMILYVYSIYLYDIESVLKQSHASAYPSMNVERGQTNKTHATS